MALKRNLKRLAALLAAKPPAGTEILSWHEPAVVETVTAGAGTGGTALVKVRWRGGLYEVAYLDSYTPTVGHTVALAVQPPQLLILGRPIGRPPTV